MAKIAWIENGKIRDICPIENPYQCYTPDIAEYYNVEVPDNAENGDFWDSEGLTKQEIVAPVELEPALSPIISTMNFLLLFTGEERVKARSLRNADPILDDFWDLLSITPTVDLSLNVVHEGVIYTLTKVKESGIAVDVAKRSEQILNNQAPS